MPALDTKIVPFPAAESLPKASLTPQVLASSNHEPASGLFRGGGLRGLFWALLLEGGVIVLAAGVIVTWRVLRH